MIKPIALLLLASSLAACDCNDAPWKNITQRGFILPRLCPPPKEEWVKQVYQTAFPNVPNDGSLVDPFPDGPKHLEVGVSNSLEAIENGNPRTGALTVKAPSMITGTPSVGLFRPGLSYGKGTVMSVRATFQNPHGPQLPPGDGDNTNAWAVGVAMRDGGLDDNPDAKRLSVTLRFKDHYAELNLAAGGAQVGTPGVLPYPTEKPPPVKINEALYQRIYDEGLSFTLEMFVDRRTGLGDAYLITEGIIQNRVPFRMMDFTKDSDLAISTVGATLANCCSRDERVSVNVKDVQIIGQKPKS